MKLKSFFCFFCSWYGVAVLNNIICYPASIPTSLFYMAERYKALTSKRKDACWQTIGELLTEFCFSPADGVSVEMFCANSGDTLCSKLRPGLQLWPHLPTAPLVFLFGKTNVKQHLCVALGPLPGVSTPSVWVST